MNKWLLIVLLGVILASACLVEGRRGNGRKSREARDVSQKAPIPPPKLDCTMDAQIKCGMALGACVPVCGADLPSCQKCFAAYGGTMWQVCCPCVKNIIPTINC